MIVKQRDYAIGYPSAPKEKLEINEPTKNVGLYEEPTAKLEFNIVDPDSELKRILDNPIKIIKAKE